jgi:putative PIN family toxin of toxin-antitoxin system
MLVFDTNLLISSALNARGRTAADVFALMECHAFAFSRSTFTEFYNVLMREKFDPYVPREDREALVKQFAAKAAWYEPNLSVRVCRDPKDNPFLELALECRAQILVTGDEDLLILNPFRGIRILFLREAVQAMLRR